MEQRSGDRVRFNVGGRILETTITTLAKAGRDSYFGAMLDFIDHTTNDSKYSQSKPKFKDHFIDRDSDCFAVLLNVLRTGELYVPPTVSEKLLYKEADFYGLTNHLQAVKWGPIDGNRLTLSHSISGHPLENLKAIRASPNGGFAVSKELIVHVYDWTLTEQSTINLDYGTLSDMLWVDTEKILVSGSSGVGLFSVVDGKLQQRYTKENIKNHDGGSLGFDSNKGHIFACWDGGSLKNGIGIWDQVTGKQIDFFNEPRKWLRTNKLQWLDERNCLFVMMVKPYECEQEIYAENKCDMKLVDFRVKQKVWSWSWSSLRPGRSPYQMVEDAVAMKDSVCVINEYGGFGFVDFRVPKGLLQWKSNYKDDILNSFSKNNKLVFHQGQVFRSVNNCVKVFSGPDWLMTSTISKGKKSVSDFSVGGDRLFTLHGEDSVVNVWETLPSK